jgi:multiple sugar transport system substrate-binding protein
MAQPAHRKPTRRDFLKVAAGAGAAAGITGAPWVVRDVHAQQKPKVIVFARESSYVKNFDEHFQKVLMPAYEKEKGVKIEYQIQAAGGSAVPQLVSMVENKSGADLAWVQQEWLYRDALVDVSDIAEEVGKQQGGWYDEIKSLSVDKGKWKSVPKGNIGQLMVYRKDWFEEAGIKKFPDTWDEFLEAGIKLKAKGHPFGMSMGHGFADNYSWMYPLLWSHGVTVMDKDGKKVALDSSETEKVIEYVKRLYKEACIEDCIGWLDPANNKAFLTSQISCTNNAYSIMVSAKRDLPEMGKVIDHALNPAGPKGRFHSLVPVTHGVFAYSKDVQGAKDLLRWLMNPKQYRPWIASGDMYFAPYLHGFDKVPEWDIEPRVKPFQKVLETGKLTSWPAPANRQHGEVVNRWVVIDMFTKSLTGTPTKTAIADAVAQLKTIYG